MRRTTFLLSCLCLFFSATLFSQPTTWTKAYWDFLDPFRSQIHLHKYSDNVFGTFLSNHVMRVSAEGNILFQKKIAVPFDIVITAFDVTREGGFILAGVSDFLQNGNSSLIKVDSDGNPVWARTLGGLSSFFWIFEIHQTTDGGYIAAGSAFPFIPASTSGFSTQQFYVWLVKFGGHGISQWQKSFNVQGVEDLRQTRDGGYAFSTTRGSLVKVDRNGSLQWQKKYGEIQLTMELARDGGFWLAGKKLGQRMRVLKTTSTGEIQWQKQYSTQDFISDIETLPDGGILLTGGTKSHRGDVVAYRIDSSGNAIWRKTYGQPVQAIASRILKLSDGGMLIAAGNSLLKTDENGEIANTCTSFIQTSTPTTLSSSLLASNRSPNVNSFNLGNGTFNIGAAKGVIKTANICQPVILGEPSRYALRPPPETDNLFIVGWNFGNQQGDSRVTLSGRDLGAAFLWSNDRIGISLPTNVQNGILTVTVESLTSNPAEFLLLPNEAQPLRPNRGPSSGGTRVVIRAPDGVLNNDPKVFFGSRAATGVKIVNGQHVVATAPAGSGTVQVQLRFGTYIRNVGDFTYTQ